MPASLRPVVLVLVSAAAVPATAQVAIDTLGTLPFPNGGEALTLHPLHPPDDRMGYRFPAHATGEIQTITAQIYPGLPPRPAYVTLELYSDSDGLPDQLLGAWDTQPGSYFPVEFLTLHIQPGVLLQTDQFYHLVVGRPDNGEVLWYLPNTSPRTGQYVHRSDGVWTTAEAPMTGFRITVPGPSAAAVLLAAVPIAARRRRGGRGHQ